MTRRPTLLVSGGTGYIGRHVLHRAADWDVHATWFSHPPDFDGPHLAWHRLDVTDSDAVAALVAALQPDVILHTAYQFNTPDMTRVIIDGTRHIATTASAVGARLIHLSTDVVFDGARGGYREHDTPRPLHAYGRAKVASEGDVVSLAPAAVIVRTSIVYGFDPPDPRTRWVIDGGRGLADVTLFTDERRCPIFAPDLAAALLELARNDFQGLLHVAGPQALSRYDFGLLLCRAAGVTPVGLKAASAADGHLVRPLDCTLDTTLARRILSTPLRSVTEVVNSRLSPRNPPPSARPPRLSPRQ